MGDTERAETKKKILDALRRIEGQIRGIQAMVESERDCGQILTQVKAASKALDRSAALVVKAYLAHCAADASHAPLPEETRKELDRAVDIVTSLLR